MIIISINIIRRAPQAWSRAELINPRQTSGSFIWTGFRQGRVKRKQKNPPWRLGCCKNQLNNDMKNNEQLLGAYFPWPMEAPFLGLECCMHINVMF